jgi:hypothetical protein
MKLSLGRWFESVWLEHLFASWIKTSSIFFKSYFSFFYSFFVKFDFFLLFFIWSDLYLILCLSNHKQVFFLIFLLVYIFVHMSLLIVSVHVYRYANYVVIGHPHPTLCLFMTPSETDTQFFPCLLPTRPILFSNVLQTKVWLAQVIVCYHPWNKPA